MAGDQDERPWDFLRGVEEYFLEDLPPDWDPGPKAQYMPTTPRGRWAGDDEDFTAADRAPSRIPNAADRNPLRLPVVSAAQEASGEIGIPILPGLRNEGD